MIGGYENPVGGYLIRAPDPPGNLLTTRSYSIVRRNEYAGSDLIPYGWEPCPPEEGRTALGLLKDFVNRLEVRE
ncbi:MAG: hypothetical protein IKQ67_01705 [Candidatus Methanomethylophilaceae archaeon]|nr:hypothetical protein [Candidatus Methanomethylophilaceae archaeon]